MAAYSNHERDEEEEYGRYHEAKPDGDMQYIESADLECEAVEVVDTDGGIDASEDQFDVDYPMPVPKKTYTMVTRKNAEEYFCETCNKLIRYPSKIREHMRKHTGEKPFACDVCHMSFSQSSTLTVHKRKHLSELPFKCSYCPKGFATQALARKHEKVHMKPSASYLEEEPSSKLVRTSQRGSSRSSLSAAGSASQASTDLRDSRLTEELEEAVLQEGDEADEQLHTYIYECPIPNCHFQEEERATVEQHIMQMHSDIFDADAMDDDDEDAMVEVERISEDVVVERGRTEMVQGEEGARRTVARHYGEGAYELPEGYYFASVMPEEAMQQQEEAARGHERRRANSLKSAAIGQRTRVASSKGHLTRSRILLPATASGGRPQLLARHEQHALVIEEDEHLEGRLRRRKIIGDADLRTKRLLTLRADDRVYGDAMPLLPLATRLLDEPPPPTYEVEVMTTGEEVINVHDNDVVFAELQKVQHRVEVERGDEEEEEERLEMEGEEEEGTLKRATEADWVVEVDDHHLQQQHEEDEEEEEGTVRTASGAMTRRRLVTTANTRRSTKQRKGLPTTSRNLDWIIDAVAEGKDVDMASPHNRRKPVIHRCQFCGLLLKYPSKIEAHLRKHTGAKPFRCEICGDRFSQRTPMRMHIRRKHTNERNFVCDVIGCEMAFISRALLNAHNQSKHSYNIRFICLKGCGRMFANARNQRNHEARCLFRPPNRPIVRKDYGVDDDDEEEEEAARRGFAPSPQYLAEHDEEDEGEEEFIEEEYKIQAHHEMLMQRETQGEELPDIERGYM